MIHIQGTIHSMPLPEWKINKKILILSDDKIIMAMREASSGSVGA